jgi:hypothetical protein
MNAKEMESVIKALQTTVQEQGAAIQAHVEAHMHLVQRADNIVTDFTAELAKRDETITTLQGAMDEIFNKFGGLLAELGETVADHTAKIDGRNKSAPTKRNMTDADALEVLTGQYKDLSHKEAAEKIGLTYAQVYSARLEFTFKHVHKTLRDEKWVNPWSK